MEDNLEIEAVIPVYKPIGFSSYDLIRIYKKKTGFKGKIGHSGTLDVFAEGVLVLLLGKATKRFSDFQKLDKEYLAGVRLGFFSNTLDIEGDLKKEKNSLEPKLEEVEKVVDKFIGPINQEIPQYSAAKYKGKPLYLWARKGRKIKKTKEVEVKKIEIASYKYPLVGMKITCSSGVYIRQLTYDIFRSLKVESFLFSLKRLRLGDIRIENCITIDDL